MFPIDVLTPPSNTDHVRSEGQGGSQREEHQYEMLPSVGMLMRGKTSNAEQLDPN
jgi:hypothetical protein